MSAAPTFVIGCARSGTSILGEAIAAHPRVAYLFEASVIWNALAPERADDRLTSADLTPEIAEAARRALDVAWNELPGDVRVEKNPKHVLRMPYLSALFPESKFLHIIRDGRDTVASLMFRNRGESWGHLKTPGWEELLRIHREAHHVRCAHQWRDAVTIARNDARALGLDTSRYLELRYEDLLLDPTTTMRSVLGYLGLDLSPPAETFLSKIQDSTIGSYHAKRQVRHYVENHSRRRGRYTENLTADQIRDVEAVCGELLTDLGYRHA